MEASLKVWSPGRLASGITLPELFTSHASVLRNKGIAQIFYDMAWIERWGSGVQKIRTACAEAGLPEPVFQEDQGFSVVFKKDIFNAEYLGLQGLNDRQIQAVAYIREHGKITNSEFQILASVKKRQSSKDLNDLEERQIISRVGKTGKGTHYILQRAPKGHKGQ
jgi:ATP-dependent DNA helicase RecG